MRDPKEVILSKGQTLEQELMEDCPDLSGADLRWVDLRWADLRRTDLSNANLYRADLCDANLTRANLYRANLYRANLTMANLYRADLCDANLTRANLYGSNLYGSNLHGSNLHGSNLYFAGLSEAENIISIGPIGSRGDILYAVRWDNGPMISMDVFWGSPEELEEYIAKSNPVDEYHRAIEFIRAWGK